MQVIQNDRYWTAVLEQAVHQFFHGSLDRRTPDAETRQRPLPETLTEPLDGRREMRPQAHRVAVGRIERHPNNGLRALDTPQLQQRRLPVANRCADHRDSRPAVAID